MGCFGSKDDRPVEEVDIAQDSVAIGIHDKDLSDRNSSGIRASFKMADLVDYKTGAGSMFMGLLAVLIILVVCIAVFKSPRGVLFVDIKNTPTLTWSASEDKLTLTGIPRHSGQVFLIIVSSWNSELRENSKLPLTPDDDGGLSVMFESAKKLKKIVQFIVVRNAAKKGLPIFAVSKWHGSVESPILVNFVEDGESGQAVTTLDQDDPNANPTSEFLKAKDDLLATNNDNSSESTMTTVVEVTKSSAQDLTSQMSGKDQDVEVITSVPTNVPEQSNGTTAVGTPTSSASATATSKPEDGVDSSAESYGVSGQVDTTFQRDGTNAIPTSELNKDIEKAGGPTLTVSASRNKLTLTGIPSHRGLVSLLYNPYSVHFSHNWKLQLTPDDNGGESVVRPDFYSSGSSRKHFQSIINSPRIGFPIFAVSNWNGSAESAIRVNFVEA
eukprot:151502_1